MGFWENIKKTAQQASVSISQAATNAGKAVAQTASSAGKSVADATSAAVEKATSFSQSAYDATCEFAAKKIKSMLRGMNLQTTIDALNKHQEEKGTDVSALVNFINELKNFSEDGEE